MAESIQQIQVEGLQNLEAFLENYADKGRMFIMFIGAIDETGDSWCSDCREGEIMLDFLVWISSNEIFAHVRTRWKENVKF